MENLNTVLKWGVAEGLIGCSIGILIFALPFCLGFVVEGGRIIEAAKELAPGLLLMTIISLSTVLGVGLGIVYARTF